MPRAPSPGMPLAPTAAGEADGARYVLALYVVGTTPSSTRAIVNVRALCERHLAGRYELEVVDLSLDPAAASAAQVIAAPTLVKVRPAPQRRFIGDMSDTDRILAGLNVPTDQR
jgi:circadian clock protein KaiB